MPPIPNFSLLKVKDKNKKHWLCEGLNKTTNTTNDSIENQLHKGKMKKGNVYFRFEFIWNNELFDSDDI